MKSDVYEFQRKRTARRLKTSTTLETSLHATSTIDRVHSANMQDAPFVDDVDVAVADVADEGQKG